MEARRIIQARYRAAHRLELNRKHREYHARNKLKVKAYYQRNKARIKVRHSWNHRKRNYGITRVQFEAMRVSQANHCAICQRLFDDKALKPHVDHCYSSGAIRGLLCFNCNSGMGNFRDDPKLLLEAIRYIELHRLSSTEGTPKQCQTELQLAQS